MFAGGLVSALSATVSVVLLTAFAPAVQADDLLPADQPAAGQPAPPVVVDDPPASPPAAPPLVSPPPADDAPRGYAVVDANGNVTNVIVCAPSVCGSGSFAGMNVVEQTAPDPVSGNVVGYMDTTYDAATGTFTQVDPGSQAVYTLDKTNQSWHCASNCPVETPTPQGPPEDVPGLAPDDNPGKSAQVLYTSPSVEAAEVVFTPQGQLLLEVDTSLPRGSKVSITARSDMVETSSLATKDAPLSWTAKVGADGTLNTKAPRGFSTGRLVLRSGGKVIARLSVS